MKKSTLNFLLAPLKLLTNFVNTSSNQKPESGDFDTGNAYRKPPVMRSALENIDQSQRKEFCGDFQ